MQADGVTRLYVRARNDSNLCAVEVFPVGNSKNTFRGEVAREVLRDCDVVCIGKEEAWSVSTIKAGASIAETFDIDRVSDPTESEYPSLATTLEQRIGRTGLTVIVGYQ